MVGAALFHFAMCELQPLIAVGISSLSICGTMLQQTYNSEVACTCVSGCTQKRTIDENSQLIGNGLRTYGSTYNGTSACMSVDFANFEYASGFYLFLLVSFWVVYSVCIITFIVEACKRRFTSIQSGDYFVFTLLLERRFFYRVLIRTYIIALYVAFIVGVVAILMQTNRDFHLMWTVVQGEILPLLVLLIMSRQLLSPTDLTEFYSWDEAKLRQVCFRRSWCTILLGKNDMLYNQIGVATIQAARGNHQYLDALVLRHGDAYALMQAVGLPCDWTSLVPCPETKAQVINVIDERMTPHGENENARSMEANEDSEKPDPHKTRHSL